MKKTYLHLLPYLLTGLFIFGYVFVRVFTIPITTDEAWTLYSFVRSPVWDIITIKNPSTNNHIFNTLLVKLTTVFSEKEFFLRLPNLLSLLLYLFGAYKLSHHLFDNKALRFLAFVALLSNFTLIHFFGLNRGYGLSMGLLMFSMAYLVQAVKEGGTPKNRRLHIILFCATMAFYANIAVLHVMAAILLATMLLLYYRGNGKLIKRMQLPITYSLMIGVLGGLKVYKQYKLGEIFYGGKANFIDDTMASMIRDITGHAYFNDHSTWGMNISVALTALAIVAPIILLKQVRRKAWLFLPAGILLFNLVMINFQFYVLDVLLPIERVAMFFFPLMILAIFSMLQLVYPYLKYASIVIALGVCAFLVPRFADNMSLHYMPFWWFDMYSEQVVNDIADDHNGEQKPKLYACWPTDNSFNYYVNIYHDGEFIESPCCTRFEQLEHPDQYDYLYIRTEHNISEYPEFKAIKRYHVDSSFILYKNTSAR